MKAEKNKTNEILIIAVLLISSILIFSVPLWDIDLWFHLATGKYIVEHKSLLQTDPFSYTSYQVSSTNWKEIILKGYWLSQIILYGAYALIGEYGLIALRVLLLFSILLTIYLWGRKNQAESISLFSVLILAGWISIYYTGERPQLFSFLFAIVVLYLLEDLKKAFGEAKVEAKKNLNRNLFLLPAIMLLWANMHQGFVVGVVILIAYLVSEIVKKLLNKSSMEDRSFYKFCIVITIAILASLFNPTTYKPYIEAVRFEGSILRQRTSEYVSPTELLFSEGHFFAPYWIYFLITIISFGLSFRRLDPTHAALAIFLAAMSLSAFRYIPFFVYLTAPLTVNYLSMLLRKSERIMKIHKAIIVILILSVFFLSIVRGIPNVNAIMRQPVKEHKFPAGAASFIKDNHPAGNIFNHFDWGGYLIWRLYPDYKVFIDGRALNLKALSHYTYMLWDTPERERLFEFYKIKIIIIPGLQPLTGEMYDSVDLLIKDDRWALVFVDDDAMVFLRGRENEEIIKKYSIPKIEAYNQIISQGTNLIKSGLNNYYVWQALARAYMGKGQLYESQMAYERAVELMKR